MNVYNRINNIEIKRIFPDSIDIIVRVYGSVSIIKIIFQSISIMYNEEILLSKILKYTINKKITP